MIDHQRPADATFLLPCLNESKGLRDFLLHCTEVLSRDQSTNWKILLADNGSTDGSREI
ncbi:MAG: glycosyltransferase, partial [Bdellovibrionota bacterium]